MLPLVTFPICNVYLPKQLNPLAPNDPIYSVIGLPTNDVTKAVSNGTAPIIPHKQLAPKKSFETGFGEQ